ncbi:MAG: IS481 family transposase [Actinomycetota bacterium]|nr:IS481 family transposase [Actinomycetota bacterium]
MSKQRVIVESVVVAGLPKAVVARQYGVSRYWVHQLVSRYLAGGWDAIEPRSKRPRSNPRTTDPVTVEAIIALRTDLAARGFDAGAATIAVHLERRTGSSPAVSTIWNVLVRAGLVTPQPRKRPRRSYLRFEADLPNECWQADFTHWHLADATGTEILCFIDDHSRLAISVTAHRVVTGTIVLDEFRAAVDVHGIPASTLTDNGLVFTTRVRHGRNSFERELVTLGVVQKNGRPNHPQTQGKVERFQQTLKKWLAQQPAATTLAALQAQLDAFADYYNTIRPHRSLHRRTPADAYAARAKATPEGRDGHWRIRHDKVDKAGHVTLRHASRLHHIGIGMDHSGTPVRMLIHDLHVTIVATETGEILRDLTLDPTRDYQARGVKPGPPKGRKRQDPRP